MRKPTLRTADTETLFNLYFNNETVTVKDITERFKVSRTTGHNVMRYVLINDTDEYPQSGIRYCSVERLFRCYGWNAKEIERKYRALKKGS